MIKINLNNEKEILNFHYDNLTIKIGRGWIVESYLNFRINKFSNPIDQNKIEFYKYLKTIVKKNAHGISILTAEPNELQNIKNHIEDNYQVVLDSIYSTDANGNSTTIREDLLNVFYYKYYDKWQAYKLANKIGVKVCPYCNRNYTFIVGSDLKKGTRFQYDHFFDKASYPYLALSFYNLVPSCNTCNSDLKGSNKFTLTDNFHPYIQGFSSDLLFSIKAKNVDFINGNPSAYRIKFKLNKKSTWDKARIKAAFRNINVFRLTELYNMHKDYVNEILQKSHVYDSGYMEDLFKNYPDLFGSIDDVKRMVLGNYTNESDFSKRPLSKLTSDISKELKIID